VMFDICKLHMYLQMPTVTGPLDSVVYRHTIRT
jgi:hypothetical protein